MRLEKIALVSLIIVTMLISTLLFSGATVWSRVPIEEIKAGEWKPLNSPRLSAICSLLIHENMIFAGTEVNGILRRNPEEEWDISKPPDKIYCLLANPGVKGEILAGTERGILIGSNYGDKWTYLEEFPQTAVYSLLLSKGGEYHLAGTEHGILRWTFQRSWQRVHQAKASYLLVNPINSDEVFAATDNGMLKGVNFGARWSCVPCDLLSEGEKVNSLALGLVSGRINIFIGTDRGNILYSEYDNIKWSLIQNFGAKNPINSLAIDTANDIYAIASGDGIFVKHGVSTGWYHPMIDIRAYCAVITKGTRGGRPLVLVASDKGIYKSAAPFEKWELIKTTAAEIYSIAVNPTNNEIFVGTNGGIFKSRNFGDSWSLERLRSMRGEDISSMTKVLSLLILDPDRMFAGTDGYGFFIKNIANGDTWEIANENLNMPLPIIHCICADLVKELIFIGLEYHRCFKSVLGSGFWIPMDIGDLPRNAWVRSMTIFSNNYTDYVLAGTDKDGIYKCTSDRIWEWEQVSYAQRVCSMLIYSKGGERVFAGTARGLFISIDSGENWIQHKSKLDNIEVYSLICDPEREVIFASTSEGVFQSWNDGKDWDSIVSPRLLHLEIIKALAIYSVGSEKYLFAGVQNVVSDNNIYCYHAKRPPAPPPWNLILIAVIIITSVILLTLILVRRKYNKHIKSRISNILLASAILDTLIWLAAIFLFVTRRYGLAWGIATSSTIAAVITIIGAVWHIMRKRGNRLDPE